MAETNTILQSNYPSTKDLKRKKKIEGVGQRGCKAEGGLLRTETSRRDPLQECGAGWGAVEDSEQKAVSVLTLLRRFVRVRSRPRGASAFVKRRGPPPLQSWEQGRGRVTSTGRQALGSHFSGTWARDAWADSERDGEDQTFQREKPRAL